MWEGPKEVITIRVAPYLVFTSVGHCSNLSICINSLNAYNPHEAVSTIIPVSQMGKQWPRVAQRLAQGYWLVNGGLTLKSVLCATLLNSLCG